MKKLFLGLMVLFVVISVFAVPSANTNASDKIDSATAIVIANTSKNFQEAFERKIAAAKLERGREQARNGTSGLVRLNDTAKAELKDALKNLSAERKELKQAENRVRVTVKALVASRNWSSPGIALIASRNWSSPGVGPKVAEIARNFNSSNQKAINAELRLEKRNAVMGFFFGSDAGAVAELEDSVKVHNEKLRELKQLRLNMTGQDAEFVDAQVGEFEQEAGGLGQVVAEQKAKRGILGWIWRR